MHPGRLCPQMSNFIISLDFELMWGLRDHHTIASYGENILGVRKAIPEILKLFAANNISATWATVGLLFCESRDEIMSVSEAIPKPNYRDAKLSNYEYLPEIGPNEAADKYYFGKSLLLEILNTPRQTIGTHTFSHYYCLEDGADITTFEEDIDTAIRLARETGVTIRSIVFPRNQYDSDYLRSCAKRGINSYRGNPPGYAYKAHSGRDNTKLKRGLRLLDAHTGWLAGRSNSTEPESDQIQNVPASRFLRPKAGKLGRIHPLHLKTIRREMRQAAKDDRHYHLWWHPHNFGRNPAENLAGLAEIIREFSRLREEFDFQSRAMEDCER